MDIRTNYLEQCILELFTKPSNVTLLERMIRRRVRLLSRQHLIAKGNGNKDPVLPSLDSIPIDFHQMEEYAKTELPDVAHKHGHHRSFAGETDFEESFKEAVVVDLNTNFADMTANRMWSDISSHSNFVCESEAKAKGEVSLPAPPILETTPLEAQDLGQSSLVFNSLDVLCPGSLAIPDRPNFFK